jgi:hypothetical protein
LPAGWFRPGRIIDMRDAGSTYRLRLDALVMRGRDFEEMQAGILA